ncbi:MAG: histidine phosphatase family protein, partial [Lachnospiraceae bacterium]|nr:histidine phosphatase family protein [Lachnospiraceae bacterium]
ADVCGADVIVCSPLLRTRQTAAEFADREITIDDRIIERTLGDFDGKWKSELMENEEYKKYFTDPALAPFRSSFTVSAPHGESYADVVKRVTPFLSDLKNGDYKKVVIVSHAIAIKCMMKVLKNLTEDETLKFKVRQCEPMILDY